MAEKVATCGVQKEKVKLAFFISNIIFSKSSLIEWKFK